jgi:hemolysin D
VIEASTLTSLGQVVTPGLQVMQIVPAASPLEIECYVENTDAGFIKPGQLAMIKVDTFPYTRYGTIEGRVMKVARDALPGKQHLSSTATILDGAMAVSSAAQQTSDLVFPVTVEPLQTSVLVDGRRLPITSGMTATVEIKTESRRAIDYVLAPIKAVLATAAQER